MKKFFESLYRKIIVPFKDNLQNPQYLAMSTAVGVFCALVPMIGQGYICFLVWLMLRKFKSTRFSLAISVAWTLVTNPATMPFVAYGYYILGNFILGGKPFEFSLFVDRARDIFANDPNWGSIFKNGFIFALDDVGAPILLGSVVVMAVLTPLSYFLAYRIAVYFKNRAKSTAVESK